MLARRIACSGRAHSKLTPCDRRTVHEMIGSATYDATNFTWTSAIDGMSPYTSINTPAMQNTSNTSTSAYTGFHHPQAQTLLEDEILDLIDAVYLMNKGKTKSNNPISDLDAAAKKMFAALGIPTDDSTLTDLLGHVEKLVVGSSSSGNFINSTS